MKGKSCGDQTVQCGCEECSHTRSVLDLCGLEIDDAETFHYRDSQQVRNLEREALHVLSIQRIYSLYSQSNAFAGFMEISTELLDALDFYFATTIENLDDKTIQTRNDQLGLTLATLALPSSLFS